MAKIEMKKLIVNNHIYMANDAVIDNVFKTAQDDYKAKKKSGVIAIEKDGIIQMMNKTVFHKKQLEKQILEFVNKGFTVHTVNNL